MKKKVNSKRIVGKQSLESKNRQVGIKQEKPFMAINISLWLPLDSKMSILF